MSRRVRTGLVFLLLVACAALVFRAALKRGGVIEDNRFFAERVLAGEFPYTDRLHPPYPPSYGIVMAPLLLLPLPACRVAWACLQLLVLFVLCRLLLRTAPTLGWTRVPPQIALAGALVLASRFLFRDMQGGGGNLVFGTLTLLACLRPGEPPGEDRHPWRGALLGLVLAAKPTPVLFLAWLWLRGRRRTLAVALGTAAAFHALPLATLGADGYARAYGQWLEGTWAFMTQADLFAEPALQFPRFSWMHQSLRYCVARYLGTVPDAFAAQVPWFFQGLGLGNTTIAWIIRGASAALLATTFAALLRARRSVSGWTELGGVAVLVSVTLLLSPITWKAHHVQLVPVFFLLLLRGDRMRGLAVYFVACTLLAHAVVGDRMEEFLQSVYVITFGALWLWWESLRSVARK